MFHLPWETFSKEQRCGASPGDMGLKKKKERSLTLSHRLASTHAHIDTRDGKMQTHTTKESCRESLLEKEAVHMHTASCCVC